MARTAFNATINAYVSLSYTVPPNKLAIFIATFLEGAPGAQVTINGNAIAGLSATNPVLKPLTANAGDVITCPANESSGNVYVITGLLYS
jgi:hypothetical protein